MAVLCQLAAAERPCPLSPQTWFLNSSNSERTFLGHPEKSVVSKTITKWLRYLTTFLCCRHLFTARRSLPLRYPPNKMDKLDDNDGSDGSDGEIIMSC